MGIHLGDLIIETTRRCNMQCGHCLRGDAEPLDMPVRHIAELFYQVESIGSIGFTGGEPSLPGAVMVIEETLSLCRTLEIPVGSFFVVTNGKEVSERFVVAMLRWYAYCMDRDDGTCMVQVSNDYYHAECGGYDTTLLDGLSFFSRRNAEEGKQIPLLQQGRVEDWKGATDPARYHSPISASEDYGIVAVEGEVYLNVYGEIIDGCDWSYANQDGHCLCKVDAFSKTIEGMVE